MGAYMQLSSPYLQESSHAFIPYKSLYSLIYYSVLKKFKKVSFK